MNKKLFDVGYKHGFDKDPQIKTMVIPGSHDVQDVLTDVVNVPTGTITATHGYKSAVDVYKKYKPQRIIGHSLGIPIAHEMNNRVEGVDKIPIQIYDSPLVNGISQIKPNMMDYSTTCDIVCMLDTTNIKTAALI